MIFVHCKIIGPGSGLHKNTPLLKKYVGKLLMRGYYFSGYYFR